MADGYVDYGYRSASPCHVHSRILPAIRRLLGPYTARYRGYLKNLAISVCGKWDSDADPLWDGRHIKLWSNRTLGQLLSEPRFRNLQFAGVGRLPWLWISMAVAGDRPVG